MPLHHEKIHNAIYSRLLYVGKKVWGEYIDTETRAIVEPFLNKEIQLDLPQKVLIEFLFSKFIYEP